VVSHLARLDWLPVLDRKLLRDMWRLRGPSFAIALMIAAGVGMVLMSFGMMRSLEATRDAYYDRYRFADIFVTAKRVPRHIVADLAALPGVRLAEGRITAGALAALPGVAEPINTRMHSLPLSGRPMINDLVLRQGRWPEPGRANEILANEAFVQAAHLGLGDVMSVILNGKREQLQIVGTVLSPEYVYAIPPGQIFPDNGRFAILWADRDMLAAAFDLTDAVNEIMLRVESGTDRADLIRRIDTRLASYGGTGAYRREDQISERFVANELRQLKTMTTVLPPIFLAVSAFLTHVVLSRLIDTEREIIGLLKAFGYRTAAIVFHYLKLALLLSLGGMVLGTLFGTWLGRGLAVMYQQFFVFPFLQFRIDPDLYALALLAALGSVMSGCLFAIRRAAALTPAAAMQPPLVAHYGGRIAAAIGQMRGLDELTRIILRGLVRRPLRTLLTAIGIGAALALYIASASSHDNVERLIQVSFDQAKREDLMISFTEPRGPDALAALGRMPGVLRVEPLRAVGAILRHGAATKREGITASTPGADLSRLVDIAGRVVEPPESGLIVSTALARSLAIAPGDHVEVEVTEGRRPSWSAHVIAVVDSPIGAPAFMSIDELDRRLGEGARLSGAYLAIDDSQRDEILRALRDTPKIGGIAIIEASRRAIRDTIAETMGIMTLFNTGFAALIVFGVVYNNARVSLAERSRDLASLRVLGFRKSEVAYLLVGELALLTLLALPIGIGMGIALSHYIVDTFSGDLFTIPFALTPATVARAILVVFTAAAGTAWLVSRRVGQLDLVAVLKTRD
jgi:putative ABC transport system permease protein